MQQVYPAHIYEPIRREIAVSYIKHELRKYFPNLRDSEAWKKMDADIATWFDGAPFLLPVRDFWNGFYGILMGFKLLIHLLDFITAENVTWTKEKIGLKNLVFSGFNPKEMGVDLTTMKVSEAVDFYARPENGEMKKAHLARVRENFAKTADRLGSIIVTEKRIDDHDELVIYKGNTRVCLALLEGKQEIEAYVSRYKSEKRTLENYWIPTGLLMELVHYAKGAWKDEETVLYQNFVAVLKHMLTFSESARFEMKDRVIGGPKEFKEKLISDLGL